MGGEEGGGGKKGDGKISRRGEEIKRGGVGGGGSEESKGSGGGEVRGMEVRMKAAQNAGPTGREGGGKRGRGGRDGYTTEVGEGQGERERKAEWREASVGDRGGGREA